MNSGAHITCRGAMLAAALGLGMCAAPAQGAELPARDEYAYGFTLETTGDAEFFAVDLPLEVYRSVSDPALRDVGVYNAAGQPVPRLLERPHEAAEGSEEEVELGLIPLHGEQARSAEQLRLLLLQEADRTRIELDAKRAAGDGPARTLAGYLIDTRELEHKLQALALNWEPLAQGFIGTVRLDSSDDLQRWRHLGSAALADLRFEETRIERNRLPLTGRISDYLRITWRDMPEDWRLSRVTGIYTGERPPQEREWLDLDGRAAGDGAFLYDAEASPPVDRVRLLLPGDNVVVRASVFYRPPGAGEDAWRLAANGVFYHLSRQGSALQSPALALSPGRARLVRATLWKVRIESGATPGPVRLQLGWRPDRLVFLAQGEPPFELVTGRAADARQGFPQETVLGDRSLFRMLRESGGPGEAAVGARRAIAGQAGLLVREMVSWKVIAVWAGLIAAIAVVGWLVYSLMRENRQR